MIDGNNSKFVQYSMRIIDFLKQEKSKVFPIDIDSRPNTVCEIFQIIGIFSVIRMLSSVGFFLVFSLAIGLGVGAFDFIASLFGGQFLNNIVFIFQFIDETGGIIGKAMLIPMMFGVLLFFGMFLVAFVVGIDIFHTWWKERKWDKYVERGYQPAPDSWPTAQVKRGWRLVGMLWDSWANKYCIPIKWD